MSVRGVVAAIVSVVTVFGAAMPADRARAADDGPVKPDAPAGPVQQPDARYVDGVSYQRAQQWAKAEAAFRDALRTRPEFPEAWNGLGYALRKQGRYDDSIRAYQEALRLRPAYPAALEYLGEAYVALGRLDDARRLLERLRALNAPEASELAEVIAAARASQRPPHR